MMFDTDLFFCQLANFRTDFFVFATFIGEKYEHTNILTAFLDK